MNGILQFIRSGFLMEAVLTREHTLNAVDYEVMHGLERLLDAAEAASDLKLFLFRARGSHFISGGDLKAFSGLKTADEGRAMADRMKAILDRIEALPCVTVALVNGDAYGGGCETALAFDQIWLAEKASMNFTQSNFALNPGWGGHLRLMERVGPHRAMRFLLNREKVGSKHALECGLVDMVIEGDDPRLGAQSAVDRILSVDLGVIQALKLVKRQFRNRRDSELMKLEADLFAELWGAEAHIQRVQDFLKRPR